MFATFASRFDNPKNAAIAAMSQASSSVKPCDAKVAKSVSSTSYAFWLTFTAKSSIAFCLLLISALR